MGLLNFAYADDHNHTEDPNQSIWRSRVYNCAFRTGVDSVCAMNLLSFAQTKSSKGG